MKNSLVSAFGPLRWGGVYESLPAITRVLGRMRLVLYEETCSTIAESALCRLCKAKDRYGKCCAIFRTNDTNPKPLFLTRDPTYPDGWQRRMKAAHLTYTYKNLSCSSFAMGRPTPAGCPRAPWESKPKVYPAQARGSSRGIRV